MASEAKVQGFKVEFSKVVANLMEKSTTDEATVEKRPPFDMNEYCKIEEAAKILGLSVGQTRTYGTTGALGEAIKWGKPNYYPKKAVRELAAKLKSRESSNSRTKEQRNVNRMVRSADVMLMVLDEAGIQDSQVDSTIRQFLLAVRAAAEEKSIKYNQNKASR